MLTLLRLDTTKDGAGNDVWLARFGDSSGGPPICVFMSGGVGGAGTTLRECGDREAEPQADEPEPQPAPTQTDPV